MPDITMCEGEDCPIKHKCYRFRAKSSEWQSYFVRPPYSMDGCKYFWRIESEEYEDRSRHRNNYGSQEDSRSSY